MIDVPSFWNCRYVFAMSLFRMFLEKVPLFLIEILEQFFLVEESGGNSWLIIDSNYDLWPRLVFALFEYYLDFLAFIISIIDLTSSLIWF